MNINSAYTSFVAKLVLSFMLGYEMMQLGRSPFEAIVACLALALAIQ